MPRGNLVDLTGKTFGRLTVISRAAENDRHGRVRWVCLCDCGNEHIAAGMDLKTGGTRSCGCLKIGGPRVKIEDLTGRRFGMLTAIRISGNLSKGRIMYVCVCDCGTQKEVVAFDLLRGHHRSCGCKNSNSAFLDSEVLQSASEKLLRVEETCLTQLISDRPNRNNQIGYRGVHRRADGRYRAILNFKKKIYRLGDYDTPQEASEAYKQAKEDLAGGLFEKYGLLGSTERNAMLSTLEGGPADA